MMSLVGMERHCFLLDIKFSQTVSPSKDAGKQENWIGISMKTESFTRLILGTIPRYFGGMAGFWLKLLPTVSMLCVSETGISNLSST